MTEPLEFRVVTKADLASERSPESWEDPYRLSPIPARKRRALLSNPLSDDGQDPVQIIATQANTVVGRLDVIVGQLVVNGEPVRCLWTSDLFVPEEFRNTLAGVRLILRLQSLHHTVGACGVSQQALPLYQGLRWLDAPMARYVLLRRSRPFVEHHLGTGLPSRISRAAIDAALRTHGALLTAWLGVRQRGLRHERADDMSPALDPQLAADNVPIAAHRSAKWINWLLENSFDTLPVRPAAHYIYDRAGCVVGYFLIKETTYPVAQGFKDVTVGSLKDWMIFDHDALDLRHLIFCALDALLRWDVDVIEVCLPPTNLPRLPALGFLRRGDLHLFLKSAAGSPLTGVATADRAVGLRPAEGDNFFS